MFSCSKLQITLFFIVTISSLCSSFPQNLDNRNQNQNNGYAKIIRHENNIGIGTYNFAYETSDGSQRTENAELKNAGTENEALSVEGSYTYVGTDGITYKVTYIADENGYRPTGEHIPKN